MPSGENSNRFSHPESLLQLGHPGLLSKVRLGEADEDGAEGLAQLELVLVLR